MSALALPPEWLAQLRARAGEQPARPRVPLWAGKSVIGSVEAAFPDEIGLLPLPDGHFLLQKAVHDGISGWRVNGEVTSSLTQIAFALRDAGLAGAWRDEQLVVVDEQGVRVGTVERAAVRPLGITTFAVHLVARSADGRHWVQQRALTKPNDPGLWDTLMGGMVPAADTLQQALERETWEEAGLRMAQLKNLCHGGRIAIRRPCADGRGTGYVVEHIDWFRCTLAEGAVPKNRDGEVAQFALLDAGDVLRRLLGNEFTLEAASVLVAAGL
ncbi:MAG: NUDIX domain-containing protein [Ramlibacter sp.]